MPQAADAFHTHAHDHRACVERALGEAEAVCARAGARLTETRRRVLALVWERPGPVGAYDLLEALSAERGRVAPPTVYRALEFLLAHGLVHRIESLNAYVGCERPSEPHAGSFLLCRACGASAELEAPAVETALAACARGHGFALEASIVELRGLCPACQGPEAR